MRMLIWLSFITTFLVITVLSVPAALDPALILYFSFDEQIDGRQVEDLTGGGNHGKLKLGAKITNEPAEVHTGAGAVKFTNISSQVRVDPFQKLDTYGDHTYTFQLYIFGPTRKPWNPEQLPHRASLLEKGHVLIGAEKGFAPAIFLTDPGLQLVYKFGEDGIRAGAGRPVFDLKTWYHIAGVKKGARSDNLHQR